MVFNDDNREQCPVILLYTHHASCSQNFCLNYYVGVLFWFSHFIYALNSIKFFVAHLTLASESCHKCQVLLLKKLTCSVLLIFFLIYIL